MTAPGPPPTPHPSLSPTYSIGSSSSLASSVPALHVHPHYRHFVDAHHRTLIPRGCSVSGLNKLPSTPFSGFTHLPPDEHGFWDTRNVSFVGRPFPMREAEEHFERLRMWGLTFVRLVIPWESLEHEGPGVYDHEYIEYLAQLIALMPKYGIKCFIDCHQDVWSRHTGGSGAPHWTLELLGLNIRNLKPTFAAHAHNLHLDTENDPNPSVWPSGYCKLAAATCATAFWGGDTFCEKRRVRWDWFPKIEEGEEVRLGRMIHGKREEEVGVQGFMQTSMIEAFGALAEAVKDLPAVLGFEIFNEPHRGYISLLSPYSWSFTTDLAIGYFPSALQSWALGSGHPLTIPHYAPSFPVTRRTHDIDVPRAEEGENAWLPGVRCIWEEHGVWRWDSTKGDKGEPVLLRAEYFKRDPRTGKGGGEEVDWYRDFYWPFCQKFSERMKRVSEDWKSFVGPIPNEFCPPWPKELRPHNLVYAPHWYDLESLFTKSIGFMSANVQGLSRGMPVWEGLYFGRAGLKKNYALQICNIVNAGLRSIGEAPIVIGETGIPFDSNGRKSFKTGNFHWQERQIDAVCCALEESLVPFNLWNYNPLNTDEWGDAWNNENFSWFSTSDITPQSLAEAAKISEAARLNVGARVLDAVERPYASKIAGTPRLTKYSMKSLSYTLQFSNPLPHSPSSKTELAQSQADPRNPPIEGPEVLARETEIYLPRRRYEKAAREGRLKVRLRRGDGEWKYDVERQTLYILHARLDPGYLHSVEVTVVGGENGDEARPLGLKLWLQIGFTLLVTLIGIWLSREQVKLE